MYKKEVLEKCHGVMGSRSHDIIKVMTREGHSVLRGYQASRGVDRRVTGRHELFKNRMRPRLS